MSKVRPPLEPSLELTQAIKLIKQVRGPVDLVPGGSIEASISIRGWSPAAVAAQPDPGRWTHVSCNLRDPKTGEWYFGQEAPSPQSQAVTHDGQTFTWRARPLKAWVIGREHLELVFTFSDASTNPPEYGSPVRFTLRIVKG